MEIITVFLIVLVIALAFGNTLLSFIGNGLPKAANSISGNAAIIAGSYFSDKVPAPKSNIKAVNEKANMAHSRLDALERFLLSKDNVIFLENLEGKMRNFDNFRANTEVELIAIKEILAELQNKGMVVKAKRFSKKGKQKKGLSDKQMHKIIYRSK